VAKNPQDIARLMPGDVAHSHQFDARFHRCLQHGRNINAMTQGSKISVE